MPRHLIMAAAGTGLRRRYLTAAGAAIAAAVMLGAAATLAAPAQAMPAARSPGPTASEQPGGVLTITRTSLPSGTAAAEYQETLSAAGGTAPYTSSVASGSLPTGPQLSTDGTLSGIMQDVGTFDFTVQVADSSPSTGLAVCTTSLPTGTYTMGATYSGNSNFLPCSETFALEHSVAKAGAGLSLSASPSSGATVDSGVIMTASLNQVGSAPFPSGTVDFTVNGTTATGCAAVAVSDLVAQCNLHSLPAGSFTLGESYSGDGNYLAQSASTTYEVGQATPAVTVSASPAGGATVTSPVSLTARVAADTGTPAVTGTVNFSVNGTTVSGCSAVRVTAGSATCPVGTLQAGSYNLTAAYSGDSNYLAGAGSITGYNVPQATPGVSLAAAPASGATVKTPVNLSATVVPLAGGPAPKGSVTFLVNGSTLAGCSKVGLTAGPASCAAGTLPAGSYTLAASYSGDVNYVSAVGRITNYAVGKLASAVAVIPDVAAPVWGQGVSFAAKVTVAGVAAASGTVQWSVAGVPLGSPVPVGPDGIASVGPVTDLAVGSDSVTATYSGTGQNAAATGQETVVVGKAASAATIVVSARRLTARVAAVAPGAGQPSGTVTFEVNGTKIGTAKLSERGVAVRSFRSSGAEVVSASYGGSKDFTSSSASTATNNPAITARLNSEYPKTRSGWYRSPVTITFTCTPGSAPLTAPCPRPVTLRDSAAAQSVTRIIHGTDGGIATVTVSPVNIDQVAPVVRVTGIKNSAIYDAPGPSSVACTASDRLSGLAGRCALTVTRRPARITWMARATDKAGNVTAVTGRARLIDYYVAGVPKVGAFFQVTTGHSDMVKAFVITAKAPHYVFAAPLGVQPHPVGPAMTKVGQDLWAIQITVTRQMRRHRFWTLGVLADGLLHTIHIELRN